MGEKNNLYKMVPVRFSLINEQHVKTLQSLERLCREAGESRSQFMINAIEAYCSGGGDKGVPGSFPDSVKEEIRIYAEGVKEDIKNEVRQELMKELLGVVSGIHPSRAGLEPLGETDAETDSGEPESGLPALEQDAGIVASAMKWG